MNDCVRLFPTALGDERGTGSLHVIGGGTTGGVVTPVKARASGVAVPIATLTGGLWRFCDAARWPRLSAVVNQIFYSWLPASGRHSRCTEGAIRTRPIGKFARFGGPEKQARKKGGRAMITSHWAC